MIAAAPARRRFPHPLVLLLACILAAAALTWIVPAGEFTRRDDPVTGRAVVVAGTYARVAPAPVGLLDALTAIPRGLVDAASILALVFLSGAGFTVVERTGALRKAIDTLVHRTAGHGVLVVPLVALVFAAGGALIQLAEEIIAFAPLLLLLCTALGLPPLMAVAVSLGSAVIGAMFSPVDPFMVAIAQKVAEVPVGSGWAFRSVTLAIALGYWLWSLRRYALAARTPVAAGVAAEAPVLATRDLLVLAAVVAMFVCFVLAAQQWHWDFDQLAMLFLAMGIVAGAVGGLGVAGTAEAMVQGARDMTFSAMIIGAARGIYVVLEQGRIVDTLVYAIAQPLAGLPTVAAALGMFAAHALLHLPVPSTSGHAVLTMPVMAPVSDLIGLPRQVAVLAYHLGAHALDLVTPTSGPLLALLAAVRVEFDTWVRWVLPRMLVVAAIAMAAIAVAVASGWQ